MSRPRFPIGRLYELEYEPLEDREAGFLGVTRCPIDFVEPVLGKKRTRAFIEQADREWSEGGVDRGTDWVVERGGDLRASGVAARVGWGWLIAHAVVFVVCLLLYIPAWRDNEQFTPTGDAYLGTSRVWGFMFLFLPIGLPWSFLAFPLVVEEPFFGVASVTPAALNLALHVRYRRRRARSVRSIGAPGSP